MSDQQQLAPTVPLAALGYPSLVPKQAVLTDLDKDVLVKAWKCLEECPKVSRQSYSSIINITT